MDVRTRKYFAFGGTAAVVIAIGGLWLFKHDYGDEPTPVTATVTEPVGSAESKSLSEESTTATSSEPQSVDNDQARGEWVRSIVAELMRQNDAKSVVSATLLMLENQWLFREGTERTPAFQSRMLDRILKSAALTPPDPSIQMLALSMCMHTHIDKKKVQCDLAELSSALQKSDPSNLSAWLHPLASARKANDTAAEDLALERMAGATQLNDHRREIDAMLRTAVESARVSPPANYAGSSRPRENLLGPEGGPSPLFFDLTSISDACGGRTTDSRARHCGRIAQNLLLDDNLLVRRTAWTIASQLPSNSTYSAQIDDAKRNLRRANWQRRQSDSIEKPEETTRRINTGDARALEELLVQNGVALEPPESWNP